MLKILGCILMIYSTTRVGFAYSQNISKRYKELWGIKQDISILKRQMEYAYIPLGEIVQQIMESSLKEHQKFWSNLGEEIKKKDGRSLKLIWTDLVSLELANGNLLPADLTEFKAIGEILSMAERKQQIGMLGMYLYKLDFSIEEIDKEKKCQEKTYRTLGVLSGMFMAIMLW